LAASAKALLGAQKRQWQEAPHYQIRPSLDKLLQCFRADRSETSLLFGGVPCQSVQVIVS